MPTDAVAEIKARLDIVEVIGGYVRLQKSGREYKGLCPFHAEKTPSFWVNAERQVFLCRGCEAGGDLLTFVQRVEHLDFREALELLAERAGVDLSAGDSGGRRAAAAARRRALDLNARAQAYYEHVLWETEAGAPGRALLIERGVLEEMARRFGIGFAPAGGVHGDALTRYLVARGAGSVEEVASAGLAHPVERRGPARDRFRNRLVFPIRDDRGAVLGFGGRALGEAIPKYLNSPRTAVYDKSTALFGIDLARRPMAAAGVAVIVEGYFDVVAAHAAGVVNVVASSGTALTREQVHALARSVRTVVLCFDGDDAGRAAASRAVDVIAAEGVEGRICVLPPGAKDPDELVRSDPAAFRTCVASAPPEWQVLLDRALGAAEGGSVEARRAGVERAVAVLVRIPEASTRQLYVQQAALRLELDATSVAADVDRARSGGRPLRPVVTAPEPPAPGSADDALADDGVAEPLQPWDAYLGSLVVQRPAVARLLRDGQGLRGEEISHRGVRRLYELALEQPDADVPLHRLSPGQQQVAARLALRALPEVEAPDADPHLHRVAADCVRELRLAALRAEQSAVQRSLRLARERGDSDESGGLATQLHQLAERAQRLREGRGGA